jgi:hypothetical protein
VVLAMHADLHAMLHHQLHQRCDIRQERQVGEGQRLVGQQARRHQGQRRVFRAADPDRTLERPAAAYAYLIHEGP